MKAFKCDRCKRFVEGPGNGIVLMPKEDHDKREYVRPQELDLCDECWAKFKMFLDILDPGLSFTGLNEKLCQTMAERSISYAKALGAATDESILACLDFVSGDRVIHPEKGESE